MRFSHISCLVAALSVYPLNVFANVHFNVPGASLANGDAKAPPTPPAKDPFYKTPAGFKNAKPGDILKKRHVPRPLLVGPALNEGNVKEAFQIMYRTTDGLHQPTVAITTLIIPNGANYSQLLSYHTFYDSPANLCAPSYTLQKGNGNTNIEGVIISTAIRQKWIVAVPDYEGIDAAFTVGKQAGFAVLDGVRAVKKSTAFSGVHKFARTAFFGYSGGALASEWAVELQPSYAPNLHIAGAAFGGLTPNITNVILAVNGGPNSDLIAKGTLGFANQYQNVSDFLDQELIPATAAEFRQPLKSCSTPKLSNKNIFSYFKDGRGVLNSEILQQTTLQNGIMGLTNTPTIPLFIFKGVQDEVSPVADTDAVVRKYCQAGASIRYLRNRATTHETEFIVDLPRALRFVKARLDGEPAATKCSVRRFSFKKLKPSAKQILGSFVYSILKDQLQQMTGGGGN